VVDLVKTFLEEAPGDDRGAARRARERRRPSGSGASAHIPQVEQQHLRRQRAGLLARDLELAAKDVRRESKPAQLTRSRRNTARRGAASREMARG
jgi:hypothetical protein